MHGTANRLGRGVDFTLHGWCRDREKELHQLYQLVKTSFSTDAFGVSVRSDKPLNKHERRAEEIMLATTNEREKLKDLDGQILSLMPDIEEDEGNLGKKRWQSRATSQDIRASVGIGQTTWRQ